MGWNHAEIESCLRATATSCADPAVALITPRRPDPSFYGFSPASAFLGSGRLAAAVLGEGVERQNSEADIRQRPDRVVRHPRHRGQRGNG